MRILQIVPHYVPAYHYGGVLHVAHSLSKALIKQGHELCVCTTNLQNPQENLNVPTDRPVFVDGVPVYYEPVLVSRYWGFSPAMTRRLWRQTWWADVVLIHFHYQFASLISAWISRLQGKPYIIFTHGSLNRYGIAARSLVRKWVYLNLLERGNFRKALFAAYHSPEEMETSLRFGRCQVVSNGIAPQSFEPLPPQGYFRQQYPELGNQIIYLYLGRLDAGKGLDLLLPAFQQLAAERSDVHLVLAGGDERGYEVTVRRMVSELGLSRRVTLTGLISGPDKLGALRDADIYVLPSRSEGLSIAMLEAMYMGLPVVVTDRVGLCRQIQTQHCGLVVPPDVGRLAEALHQMAAPPNQTDMGRRGHQLVNSHYTWNVIARDLVARVQELITQ